MLAKRAGRVLLGDIKNPKLRELFDSALRNTKGTSHALQVWNIRTQFLLRKALAPDQLEYVSEMARRAP